MELAKTIQFARIAGLQMAGVDAEGSVEWMGTERQFKAFYLMQAKDDRGEFTVYPWKQDYGT